MNKKTILSWESLKIIEKLKDSLRNNLINITSTDTVPGLLSNTTKKSFDKLNKLKKNRGDKPYLILVSTIKKIKNFVDIDSIDSEIKNLIKKCWPGPVTIIFKAKNNLPFFLKSRDNTVAIRCPQKKPLLKLLESFDGLFSTSANTSGKKAPKKLVDIEKKIVNSVNLIVVDDHIKEIKPSTIIDVTKQNKIKLIREGEYKIEKLEKCYGKKIER